MRTNQNDIVVDSKPQSTKSVNKMDDSIKVKAVDFEKRNEHFDEEREAFLNFLKEKSEDDDNVLNEQEQELVANNSNLILDDEVDEEDDDDLHNLMLEKLRAFDINSD